jgi:putative holliday junction resolvase
MDGQQDGVLTMLAFDVGARRTGVAVGNSLSGSARPVGILDVYDAGPDWPAVDAWMREWMPNGLVVGNPLTQDGENQPARDRAIHFARSLQQRYGKPVSLMDERNTSIEAAQRFAESRARGESKRHQADQLDAWAAVIILERWFQQPHNRTDLDVFA